MGTDISIFVERRRGTAWASVPPPSLWGSQGSLTWRFVRCYESFRLLAGIRDPNGRVVSVSSPRGLPTDLSEEVRREIVGLRLVHPSWLTAGELLSANLDQRVIYDGWVDAQGYREIMSGRPPSTPMGMIPEANARKVSPEVMGRIVEEGNRESTTPYTVLEWTEPLGRNCPGLLEFLKLLKTAGDPSVLRVVFGFDYV